MSEVNYKALGNAVERLREALALLEKHPADELHVSMRDSALLSFQFTYELSVALLRRFLESNMASGVETKEMTFPTLIRVACEHGLLLHDLERWMDYRKARDTLSHAYDEARAEMSLRFAAPFLEEAEHLHKRLVEESP